METILLLLVAGAISLVTIAAVCLIVALPVMWLWNYAAVDVLHVARLDFWHALCLMLLCSILFKYAAPSPKAKTE